MKTWSGEAFQGYKQEKVFTGKTWAEKKEKREYPRWNEVNMWNIRNLNSQPGIEMSAKNFSVLLILHSQALGASEVLWPVGDAVLSCEVWYPTPLLQPQLQPQQKTVHTGKRWLSTQVICVVLHFKQRKGSLTVATVNLNILVVTPKSILSKEVGLLGWSRNGGCCCLKQKHEAPFSPLWLRSSSDASGKHAFQ